MPPPGRPNPYEQPIPPRQGTPPQGAPRPERAPLLHPRKVRGGVKLSASNGVGDVSLGWAAQRWSRLVEQAAEGSRLREGLDYAKLGQTRSMSIATAFIEARVQGRADRPYAIRLQFETFSEETWTRVIESMAEGAIYAAKLLSGEVPANIEDLFVPLGLHLFPTEVGSVRVSCTCGDEQAWCKHVCCIAHLFASRLSTEPFLMFALRGMNSEELQERLRQRRAVSGLGTGSAPVYVPRVPGVSDVPSPALDANPEQFWDPPASLREIDLPLAPPQVSHPLLRRLGPSPFPMAPFPLVGLLASCYEAISHDAVQSATEPHPTDTRLEQSPGDDSTAVSGSASAEAGVNPEAATGME